MSTKQTDCPIVYCLFMYMFVYVRSVGSLKARVQELETAESQLHRAEAEVQVLSLMVWSCELSCDVLTTPLNDRGLNVSCSGASTTLTLWRPRWPRW